MNSRRTEGIGEGSEGLVRGGLGGIIEVSRGIGE